MKITQADIFSFCCHLNVGFEPIQNAVRNLGAPVELAQRYYDEGADEVTFLNITGFRENPLTDSPMRQAHCSI